jgi:hypothetical protein
MTDNEIATNFHKLAEVPMNTHDELLLWHALHRLEVTYWYDVDFNEGRTAHEFFTPDGVQIVGHNRFGGREGIRAFYEWRARQNGAKAVRHLITNLYVAWSTQRTLRDSAGHSHFPWRSSLSIEASIKSPNDGGRFYQ